MTNIMHVDENDLSCGLNMKLQDHGTLFFKNKLNSGWTKEIANVRTKFLMKRLMIQYVSLYEQKKKKIKN